MRQDQVVIRDLGDRGLVCTVSGVESVNRKCISLCSVEMVY